MRPTNFISFFNYIKFKFGHKVLIMFKSVSKFYRIIINNKLRVYFLRRCISSDIVPSHVRCLHNFDNNFFSYKVNNKFKHIKRKMVTQLLKLEIQDAFCRINYATSQLCTLAYKIYQIVPVSVCNEFYHTQYLSFRGLYGRELMRLNKKLNWLTTTKVGHTQPNNITYFFNPSSLNEETPYSVSNLSFIPSTHSNLKIDISPPPSTHPQNPFLINDKWFINLSTTTIPIHIQSLLQLGDNFSLPFSNINKLTTEFIKNIENNLYKLPVEKIPVIRDRSTSHINRLPSISIPNDFINTNLVNLSKQTNKFLRDNPNIILTRADKGNITVAMDRDSYNRDMESLLDDKNTYIVTNKNPLKKMTSSLRDLLTRWKNHDYISPATHRNLSCSDGILPRAYGLPKVHKPNNPLRIIVSSIDSPFYSLAVFLHKIMYNNFPRAHSSIRNSFELINKLDKVSIEEGHSLISLDVVSLFTNIPVDVAVKCIQDRWEFISPNCAIPMNEFLIAIRLVLHSTYFLFNNTIYQQTYGTPMGSPLSPIIADIVMQELENRALSLLNFNPPFYIRYVDDVVCAIPEGTLDHTLKIFNSIHPRLQFTSEIGSENELNFLDVTLHLTDKRLIFDWYHKPTFSGRYLNYYSHHPACQKRGTVIGLVDRVILLSHPTFHEKNFSLVIQILTKNNYPLDFIFDVLRERIKFLIHTGNSPKNQKNNNTNPVSFFTIPYVPNFSEKFINITRHTDVRISYQSLNKLNKIIKTHKDPLPDSSQSNVVYKINCCDCDASYVGQTGRQLNTRIKEHKNHILRNNPNRSVITEHRLNYGHDFDWQNVKILDHESFYHKRLVSEMLYIKRQKNSLNLQTDTENLHHSYCTAVDNLSKI